MNLIYFSTRLGRIYDSQSAYNYLWEYSQSAYICLWEYSQSAYIGLWEYSLTKKKKNFDTGQMDRQTDGRTDGQTDRVASIGASTKDLIKV